ncbi:hypothetical protein [Mycolicibacterium arenosum]|uniref:DUF5666 domain-containing protein n=1 Tax=Mycolicibacterium arenosum TaxID=2952157 RepID=A0ABT1M282_9MYCO|nr:hypothetical protein [Mycolicibacterium sp. CAU 1645]MCP9272567.1 hypothetical protein [Mycolicibacterium sp. CAU 1645]
MPDTHLIAVVFLVFVALGAALSGPLVGWRAGAESIAAPANPSVAVGTVRTVSDRVTIDVESVSGQRFVGRLRQHADDHLVADLRPGVVLLVAFDPDAREALSLADDMVAVRAAFDRMLLRKGLLTAAQLELIRHGTRSRGVVTGMRATGGAREDYREVELDLMVRRPEGGQFPAHETTLVPASALGELAPGSIVEAYYRRGDESAVAVCVPPN